MGETIYLHNFLVEGNNSQADETASRPSDLLSTYAERLESMAMAYEKSALEDFTSSLLLTNAIDMTINLMQHEEPAASELHLVKSQLERELDNHFVVHI